MTNITELESRLTKAELILYSLHTDDVVKALAYLAELKRELADVRGQITTTRKAGATLLRIQVSILNYNASIAEYTATLVQILNRRIAFSPEEQKRLDEIGRFANEFKDKLNKTLLLLGVTGK